MGRELAYYLDYQVTNIEHAVNSKFLWNFSLLLTLTLIKAKQIELIEGEGSLKILSKFSSGPCFSVHVSTSLRSLNNKIADGRPA